MKGFSIIIPTYDRAELLRAALQSLQSLRVPSGWEAQVLVIDNNCTDHTAEVAKDATSVGPLPVRHIVERNQGLNNARNRGWREASFSHLVYLDDDMLVDPGWLESYVQAQRELAPDAVIGPVDPMFEEDPPDWMTEQMIRSVTSAYSQKGDRLILVPANHAHEIPGCNFSVLRDVARELGGFHSALDRCGSGMLAGGDWEFGERAVLAGKRVAYSPGCRIRHLVSRKKLSRGELRARWVGNGATRRALMQLRGEEFSTQRWMHLSLRMIRLYGRALRLATFGATSPAFRWELEAASLRGLLFGAPKGLAPRSVRGQRDTARQACT